MVSWQIVLPGGRDGRYRPIEPNDPTSPSNRRISIVLLKQDFSDQAADALASRQPSMQPRETIPAPVIAPDTGSALPPLRSGG